MYWLSSTNQVTGRLYLELTAWLNLIVFYVELESV
jgi:hypothetical protein